VLDSKLRNFLWLLGQKYPLPPNLYEFIRAGMDRLRSRKAFCVCVPIGILTLVVLLPVHMNKTLHIRIQKIFETSNISIVA